MQPSSVNAMFLATVREYPRRNFLRYHTPTGDRCVTYEDAARKTAALVTELGRLGLRAGDRVAFYTEDPLSLIYFSLACMHAGVVPAGLSPPSSLRALKDLVADLTAAAVFTSSDLALRLLAAGTQPMVILEHGGTKRSGTLPLDVRDLPTPLEALSVLSAFEPTPDTLFQIQPTSGSTGRPKLAMRTHRTQVRAGLVKTLDLVREGDPERILLITPLTHAMAQGFVVTAIALAAELAIPSTIGTLAPLQEIRELDPTYVPLVPRMLRELLRQHRESGGEGPLLGPSAKVVASGGAPPDVDALRSLEASGIDIVESYGGSESSVVAFGPRGGWRPGYIGQLLPDVEARVGPDGELFVRSPGLFPGYFGDERATKAVFTEDGFFRTGDFLEIDGDRYVRHVGRKKDVFNTYDGSNIYPQRAEALVEGLSWVHQVVLLGDQRPYVIALIVPKMEGRPGRLGNDGYLEPEVAKDLYERARRDLAAINAQLEANECIRGVALFGTVLIEDVYKVVAIGKVARDRVAATSLYREHVERLYGRLGDSERVADAEYDT